MSEVIKVVVTSDSAQLQADLAKAAASVSTFQKRTKGIALPEIELTPKSLQSMERAAFLAQDLSRKTRSLNGAGKNGALGFLAVSQAVEDAQYGLRGVLNNIPQAVLGFGGGAGLAGALSLAAVAAYQSFVAFQKLSGIKEMEEWAKDNTKANEAFTDSLKKSHIEAAKVEAQAATLYRISQARIRGDATISSGLTTDPRLLGDIDARKAAEERARAAQNALLSSATGAGGVSAETPRQTAQRDIEAAKLKYLLDQSRATKDIASNESDILALGKELDRVWRSTSDIAVKFQSESSAAGGAQDEILKQIAAREAEAARAQSFIDSNKSKRDNASLAEKANGQFNDIGLRNNEKYLLDKKAEITALKSLLDEKKKEAALNEELLASALAAGKASQATLQARIDKAKEEISILHESKRVRDEIALADQAGIRLNFLKGEVSELKKAADAAKEYAKATMEITNEFQQTRDAIAPGNSPADFLKNAARQQEAERRSKASGGNFSTSEAAAALKEQEDNQKAAERKQTQLQGTLKERGEARRSQRAEDRQLARDERVRDSALAREKRNADRAQKEKDRGFGPQDTPKPDLNKPNDQAAADLKAAQDALKKNGEDQLEETKKLTELLRKIEPKLPTAALGI